MVKRQQQPRGAAYLNRSAFGCSHPLPLSTHQVTFFHYTKTKLSFLVAPKIGSWLCHRRVWFEDMGFSCDTAILPCLPTGNCSVSYDTASVNVVHQRKCLAEGHKRWRGSQAKMAVRLQYFKEVKERGEIKLEPDLQFTKWTSGVCSYFINCRCVHIFIHSPDVEREIHWYPKITEGSFHLRLPVIFLPQTKTEKRKRNKCV